MFLCIIINIPTQQDKRELLGLVNIQSRPSVTNNQNQSP